MSACSLLKARILSNEEVEQRYFRLSLSTFSDIEAMPGQFLMLRVSSATDPLLCRPFGFHRILSKNSFEILYKIIGRGTDIMSRLATGTDVQFFGPLGRGFDVTTNGRKTILVAGGIGVAPLMYLAESLREEFRETEINVFIGGKTKRDVLCIGEFEKIGALIHIATEDGSLGERGLITALLQRYISETPEKKGISLNACGPQPMLKKVAEIAEGYNIPCQVSLEGILACGVGACRGCAVKVKSQGSRVKSQKKQSTVHSQQSTEYKMICKDGPVFDAREVEWE